MIALQVSRPHLESQLDALEAEEKALHATLPDYVQKLILGYELRTYYFELIECFRKLAIVCLPVFFSPSGSVSQLIFGLMVRCRDATTHPPIAHA